MNNAPSVPPPTPWETLTARERQVALYLATGMTCREIANEIKISIKTVDTHRSHVMKKLGTRNNVELLLHMLKIGHTL